MDDVNGLISVIQVVAVPFAILKIVRIAIDNWSEEDHRPAFKKIRNVFVALAIILLIFEIIKWLNGYFKFM